MENFFFLFMCSEIFSFYQDRIDMFVMFDLVFVFLFIISCLRILVCLIPDTWTFLMK